MNEPTIKGWVWNIPFYPCSLGGRRTIKSVFWYDSSNDLEFTKHTDEYQIVVPEDKIIGLPFEKDFIRKNVKDIFDKKTQLIYQDKDGNWRIELASIETISMFTKLG